MASIVKRKKKYSVVYRVTDTNGATKQKWESFGSYNEALKRKNEVDFLQQTDTFKPPSTQTVREMLYDFMLLYGKNHWALSTYAMNKSLIDNYVSPIIGDIVVSRVTTRVIDEYYNGLKTTPAAVRNGQKNSGMVTPHTIHEIHKVLRCAFNQAVKWELLDRNPVVNASKPKVQNKQRDIWTPENVLKAIKACDDTKLALGLQLAFGCTMRLGEITGLQWDSVDISDEAIESDAAYIQVHQELSRVSKEAMDVLEKKDVKFIFPALRPRCTTCLVLKTPKTESSNRKIYIPRTLALILQRWRDEQAELKEVLQDDYHDYNLVVTQSNGRPVEHRVMDKALRELTERESLPVVVFHSLRHASATFKLKLTNGSMKDIQNEGGWSTVEMIAKVYARTYEEDRKSNAQKFDEAFYGGLGYDGINDNPMKKPSSDVAQINADLEVNALISLIQANPQIAQALRAAMAPIC
jgi:integrase